MKCSSTEPKFDISMKNITGKNTFLNSKNAFLYFARFFRLWVISARAVSARVISICGSFYPESKTWQTKTNEFQGSFFLIIYSRTKECESSECHSIKNTFFSKKKMKVIGFRYKL